MQQEIYDQLPVYNESPEFDYSGNDADFVFGDYRWVCTFDCFPEQYEVFYKEKQVAYVRLRGSLAVYAPDCVNGQLLLSIPFEEKYKGRFNDQERKGWINFIQYELEMHHGTNCETN